MGVPMQFLSTVLLSLAVSLICTVVMMMLQGWLQRLRGCGGLMTVLLVVAGLLALALLLDPTR